MASSFIALWDSLSGTAAGWQARRANRIQVGLPTSSPEGNDAEEPMEEAADDEPLPPPSPVHVGITMGEAWAHFTDMVV
jgi:hypothetical protein